MPNTPTTLNTVDTSNDRQHTATTAPTLYIRFIIEFPKVNLPRRKNNFYLDCTIPILEVDLMMGINLAMGKLQYLV